MKVNTSIFREYDIRGIAGKDIDESFAARLGVCYAQLLKKEFAGKKPKIVVGKDCRVTSDSYTNALVGGLLSSGIDVVEIGTCPTPLGYFTLFHLDLDGCVMVTASHNPGEFNGFKLCMGKNPFYAEALQELMRLMESENAFSSTGARGARSEFNVLPAYIERVKSDVKPKRRLKVVLDAGNATAGTVAPPLFQALGAEVFPIFCELDGTFPNHHPDPTVEENLKDLKAKVLEVGADFGVAFDGDSDRIGAVSEKGEMIYGDLLMILLSRAVLLEKPGATILSEVKSSYRLYDDIRKHGGKPIMWKTGHSLIKAKMKETKAALAGEMSGHVFFADRYYGFDDAIYTAARLYEILASGSATISERLADVPPAFSTPELRVDCQDPLKFKLVEETKKELLEQEKGAEIVAIDGIRMNYPDGWGLIRASNTQPVLVLRFEARNETRLDEIRRIVQKALDRAAARIGHPTLRIP